MMIKEIIEQNLKDILKKQYPQIQLPEVLIFNPPKDIDADYSTNIGFSLTKQLKRNLNEVVLELIEKISLNKNISKIINKIEQKNGYINFKLDDKFLIKKIVEISKVGFKRDYLIKQNKNKIIIVEYSSPNIAKKMHAGHLRSTIIGDALKNIFLWLGYKVIAWNHLGDWGTQFGKLLYMYKEKYGTKIIKLSIDDLEKLYIEFHKIAQQSPSYEQAARQEIKKLQEGDKINLKIWRYFTKISLLEFNKLYKILGIKFDYVIGESFYQKYLSNIIKEAFNKKIALKSQGAVIIPLEKFNLPPFLIQKKDKAFLYSTTDLASLKYRIKNFHPSKIIYVVANEQTLHFQQLFAAAKLLGIIKDDEVVHAKFGLLLNEQGKKFSTRGGNIVYLEHLINEVINLAYNLISKKNPNLTEKEKRKIAKIVGIGAIKYNDLSRDRQSDIVFNKTKMLSLEGNSCSYLQYTIVRINSILKKAGKVKLTKNVFSDKLERDLAVLILKFPEIILEASQKLKPNILADYLYNIASTFHRFYEVLPVLSASKQQKSLRLILIKILAKVVNQGLNILGIKSPSKM